MPRATKPTLAVWKFASCDGCQLSLLDCDDELRGCPINKQQLLEVLIAYLHHRKPNISPHSVCMECKQRGTVCVLVRGAASCLGPVTHAGCGAICPAYNRGCYGCYGPKETPN